MSPTYYIKTFGCQQNESDSERIAAMLESRGMVRVNNIYKADRVIINTCMVRQMAEHRVYGTVNNLVINKLKNGLPEKIIVTGCMVGMAVRDKTGNFLRLIKKRMPYVDEFLNECRQLIKKGFKKITLLGMNVNSYGADLVAGAENVQVLRDWHKTYFGKKENISGKVIKNYSLNDGRLVKPVYVKHLKRLRIPTLFPMLLEDIASISDLETVNFISSNPWDFSDELIDVISRHGNITRSLHIAVQSGSNSVLKRMNRWYTGEQYLRLLDKIRGKIKNVRISTDIIVGFCGETEKEFNSTLDLAKRARFYKAYISMYSDRPQTAAHKVFKDDVPHNEKKKRWQILEDLINGTKK